MAARKTLLLCCTSFRDINASELSLTLTTLNHTKNFVVIMGDAIADHYSRSHQSGGFYKQMGMKYGHAVPLQKHVKEPYLERSSGKNATVEAKDYAKLSSQAREAQKGKRARDETIVKVMVRAQEISIRKRSQRERRLQNINVV